MKKMNLLSALFMTILLGFVSCSKDDSTPTPPVQAQEAYIDATSKTTWHYFNLAQNKIVGTGEENKTDNGKWAERKDWDIAVNRYMIRTNSGAATSVGALGGVYTYDASIDFNAINSIPANVTFAADEAVTSEGMNGTTTMNKSKATVILFKKNPDGSMVMPPVYLQAPVYLFRTADGKGHYKVKFTQYQNESKVTGHVKFYSSKL